MATLQTVRSKVRIEHFLKERFKEICGGKNTLTYNQFVDVTGCRSELFALRLFEAMDIDKSGDISLEECTEVIHILQSRDSEQRKRFIFDLIDIDHDGVISEAELSEALCASLEEGDVATSRDERNDLVSALVHFFDIDQSGEITYDEFDQTLEMYPDMLEGFSLEGIATCRPPGIESRPPGEWNPVSRWIVNHVQGMVTYVLLAVVLIGCFFWRFQRYMWTCDQDGGYEVETAADTEFDRLRCRDARKRMLMGWSLPIAKGAAQAMKAVFTLILFPVSRRVMTNLRQTSLKYLFNFDANIDFHKVLGTIGFFLAWIHTLCHICDIKRWTDPSRRRHYFNAFPYDTRQPSVTELLQEQVAVTGAILIVVYSVAALFALDYPRKLEIFNPKRQRQQSTPLTRFCASIGRILNNFNNFWYTHHLFVIFYICLCFHPKPALPHEYYEWGVSDSWVWICGPVAIYVAERLLRALMSSARDTGVISAHIHPGNVVELKIMKPRGFVYIAGQFVFLNCPMFSRFEWHPFTLTSSPGDSYLSVHIRVNGDWTQALYDAAQEHWGIATEGGPSLKKIMDSRRFRRHTTSVEIKSVSGINTEVTTGSFPLRIKVDGPFGAPSQNFKDYKIVLLIGAGIGVTPFASVLSDLLELMKNHKCSNCGCVNIPKAVRIQKVYFYWTVRSRKEAAWFKHVLEAISEQDDCEFIDINIHVTSFRQGVCVCSTRSNDLRVMLLRLAQHHAKQHGVDPLAGMRSRAVTHFGRPNWSDVFQKVKIAHINHTNNCGVFYCGPNSLAQVLREEARKQSSKEMVFELNTETFG